MTAPQQAARPRWLRELVVPTHWSFLLGPVAVISFLVLLVTGLVLTFFYEPSAQPVVYRGSAELYDGRELPAAFASVVSISEDVPGGLLLRRVHRVASYVFVAAALAHFLRVLLQGAYRRRRLTNYVVGLVLLALAAGLGWSGQNLIYDVVTGSSIRIGYTIAASIPYVGPGLADVVFAGPDVDDVVPRLFWLHVLVLPLLFAGALAVHLWLAVRHRHTVVPRRRAPGGQLVVAVAGERGLRSRTVLLGLLTTAVLVLAAALVPFGDVTHVGPFLPGVSGNDMYPDWYLLPAEGAILLIPGVELSLLGTTVTNPLLGGVVLPALAGLAVLLYPALDSWLRDRPAEVEDVAERPTDAPLRVAVVTLLLVGAAVVFLGAASDVLARMAGVPVADVMRVLRWALLLAPPLSALLAYGYARRARRRRAVSRSGGPPRPPRAASARARARRDRGAPARPGA